MTGGTQGFIETGDDGGWGESVQFPRIQGADVCGRVAALGEGVSRELLGQRVMIDTWIRDWNDPDNFGKCRYFGSECDGGYAEYTTVDARNVHSIESPLSDAELATFATSWVTAENMLDRAAVVKGDVVLVTGASGGVGTALVQLIRRRSATPVALCSESKANQLRGIGADAILPREPHDLSAALDQAIGRRSVDVIADVVGGPLWPQLIDVLRPGGRYTCAGAIAGPIVEFDLRTFYLNDLTFTGATVIPQGLFARLVGYIERGVRCDLPSCWTTAGNSGVCEDRSADRSERRFRESRCSFGRFVNGVPRRSKWVALGIHLAGLGYDRHRGRVCISRGTWALQRAVGR